MGPGRGAHGPHVGFGLETPPEKRMAAPGTGSRDALARVPPVPLPVPRALRCHFPKRERTSWTLRSSRVWGPELRPVRVQMGACGSEQVSPPPTRDPAQTQPSGRPAGSWGPGRGVGRAATSAQHRVGGHGRQLVSRGRVLLGWGEGRAEGTENQGRTGTSTRRGPVQPALRAPVGSPRQGPALEPLIPGLLGVREVDPPGRGGHRAGPRTDTRPVRGGWASG